MELWIRSQDRLLLSRIDYVKVNGFDIFNQDELIGTYSTYERALEVLDEIQNILIDYSKMSRVVYEMPKE